MRWNWYRFRSFKRVSFLKWADKLLVQPNSHWSDNSWYRFHKKKKQNHQLRLLTGAAPVWTCIPFCLSAGIFSVDRSVLATCNHSNSAVGGTFSHTEVWLGYRLKHVSLISGWCAENQVWKCIRQQHHQHAHVLAVISAGSDLLSSHVSSVRRYSDFGLWS